MQSVGCGIRYSRQSKNSIEILHANARSFRIADSESFMTNHVSLLRYRAPNIYERRRSERECELRKQENINQLEERIRGSDEPVRRRAVRSILALYLAQRIHETEGNRGFSPCVATMGHLSDRLVNSSTFLCTLHYPCVILVRHRYRCYKNIM